MPQKKQKLKTKVQFEDKKFEEEKNLDFLIENCIQNSNIQSEVKQRVKLNDWIRTQVSSDKKEYFF